MTGDARVTQRRAIEALRSGVPNRDAVVALGCAQAEIEARFRTQLESVSRSGLETPIANGMLVQGGFGSGKSHLFEYLQHLAIEQNFICSKIVISKETPLHDPAKMFRAAVEAAVVPGKRGAAITEIAMQLDFRNDAFAELQTWVSDPAEGLNPRFPAMLFLYQRMQNDPEISNRIIRFWSGDQVGVGEIKKYLKACREPVTYRIDPISIRDLSLQRFSFTSRMIRAAGYSGWVLLIDEVELIARYSIMQRAKSYAELARWMGQMEGSRFAGLTAVLAITDDFRAAVLDDKDDEAKVPNRLRAKGSDSDLLLASQAERGMRIIRREGTTLQPPDSAAIDQTYESVRLIHSQAYDWEPPSVRSVERLASTRMRQYVKGWITEWDLRRLDPAYAVELEANELKPDYEEDRNLEVASEEDATGGVE